MKYVLYLFICLSIGLTSCTQNNTRKGLAALIPNTEADTTISKRQLRRNGSQKREILVVYNAENEKLKTKYNTLLEEVSKQPQQGRFSITTKYKSLEEVTNEDLTNSVLLLVGTPEDNDLIKEFTETLPLSFSKNTITFNKNLYSEINDVFSLQFYPNPKNNTLPFSLITGNDANTVFEFVNTRMRRNGSRRNFFRSMEYEIFRNGSKVTMGNFKNNWSIDENVYFNYSTGNDTIATTEHFNFISHQNAIPSADIEALTNDVETSTKTILTFIGKENYKLPKINYHIYKTAEDKGLMLGNTEQANFNIEDNSVHTIINDKYRDNFIQKENNLLIKQLIGESKSLTLGRGLPVFFTTKWQRKGYQYWASRLTKSNNALSLKELFDNELVQNESDLVVDCMSATLVGFLIQNWGVPKFLEQYNNWTPNASDLNRLEPKWQQHLKTLAKNTTTVKKRKLNTSYLKGFNFAHEGYGIYNGYLSRKATEALVKQKEMGVNAITIVPYSYMRYNGETSPTYLPLNKGAGSENDQGVIHSAYEAKKLGMSVLLKPQVFVGRGWSGDMEFSTEQQWQDFFDYYYRWIRHYAFLAEIHNIDMLAVGVEFSKAMLTHQDNWVKMIKNLRGLYSGQLTYCANWGEEFETISLWNDLDFIGINSYYPLSDKNDATDEDLKATFETVKSKIKKVYNTYKKPIVFTEIGFRSINAPWKLPYSNGDNTIFNEDHQDRAYKVIFEGIKNEPWCKGILWWKFPSYLEYRGRENPAFTPNNKKAEATVKKWFSDTTLLSNKK